MKKLFRSLFMSLIGVSAAFPALAAAGAREDNSMVLVYFFLAVCGLIIFLQLIPVMTLVYSIIKGIFSKKEEETKTAPVKYH